MKAHLEWKNKMNFECDNHGLKLQIDATPEHGGNDLGPSPKELVLNAMMGCTAMDVVSILTKMRQDIKKFTMDIDVEKNLEHPIYFKRAVLYFNIDGNVEQEKALKAINSSLTKYCGVNYMISKTCDILFKLVLNGVAVAEGKTAFTDPQN